MNTLIFAGEVTAGDAWRCDGEDDEIGAIRIADHDIVSEIQDAFPSGTKVTVGLMHERFDGELFIETGWGYSEYTPMDSDELKVGTHDLIAILSERVGGCVRLVVSDGPIDLLDL